MTPPKPGAWIAINRAIVVRRAQLRADQPRAISWRQTRSAAKGPHAPGRPAARSEIRVPEAAGPRNEQDRRAFDVRLTRKGSALVARVDRLISSLDDDVGADLDRDERRILIGLLMRLASDLQLSPGVHPHLGAASRQTNRPAA